MKEFDFGSSLDIGKTLESQRKEKAQQEEQAAEDALEPPSDEAPDKGTVKPVSRHAPKATDLAKNRKVKPVKILREREDDTDVVVTSTTVPLDDPKPVPHAVSDSPWWALLAILLVVGSLSWFTLIQTQYLPQMDARAAQFADGAIVPQVVSEVKAAYPYLSDVGFKAEVEKRVEELRSTPEYAARVAEDAAILKGYYSQKSGTSFQPFLYKADTYLYYRMAQDIVENRAEYPAAPGGHEMDVLRLAPSGTAIDPNWWPKLIALYHRFGNRFSSAGGAYSSEGSIMGAFASSSSLLESMFFLPAILGVITSLLFVLLVMRLSRSLFIAGIAGVIFAIHPLFFLGTFAGNADTQSPAMLLSVLVMLLVSFSITSRSAVVRWACGAGIVISLWMFSHFWKGWPYILIIVACFALVWMLIELLHAAVFRRKMWCFGAVAGLVAACALVSIRILTSSFGLKAMRYLTGNSDNSIYPTLIGAITELQSVPFEALITALGGRVMLVVLAATLVYLIYRTVRHLTVQPALLLAACWFVPLFVATLLARRFSFYLVAPAVLLFALGLHAAWPWLCRVPSLFHFRLPRLPTQILLTVIVLGVVIPFFTPYWAATSAVPAMSVAHVDVGRFFDRNVAGPAVIDAWWDEGYVWQAVTRKATIWDNAAFDMSHAYWLPRAMTSRDPVTSAAVLRLENCGTIHSAYQLWKSEEALVRAALNRSAALEGLRSMNASINAVNLTDCIPRQSFVIVTEEMFAKMPQMLSLSRWSLRDGEMRRAVDGMREDEALRTLSEQFNLSAVDARQKYALFSEPILSTEELDISNVGHCSPTDMQGMMACSNFLVNLSSMDATQGGLHPAGLTVVKDGVRRSVEYADARAEFSVIVMRDANSSYWSMFVDKSLLDMTIVRLFSGESLPQFERVFETHVPQRITVHRIVYEPVVKNVTRAPANVSVKPAVKNESIASSILAPAKNETPKNMSKNSSSLHSILLQGVSS